MVTRHQFSPLPQSNLFNSHLGGRRLALPAAVHFVKWGPPEVGALCFPKWQLPVFGPASRWSSAIL